jgi:hypothetical protein
MTEAEIEGIDPSVKFDPDTAFPAPSLTLLGFTTRLALETIRCGKWLVLGTIRKSHVELDIQACAMASRSSEPAMVSRAV